MFTTANPLGRRLSWQLRLSRAVALVILVATTVRAAPHPGFRGIGLVVAFCLAAATAGWIWQLSAGALTVRAAVVNWLLTGGAGAVLAGLSPHSAALTFPAVALHEAGARLPQDKTLALTATLLAATSISRLGRPWGTGTVELLVLAACALLGTFRLQGIQRAEQNELLLSNAETAFQERARAATLAERSRIAREIHDIHAHSLAALSVQLKVIDALVEQGSDGATVRPYIDHAQYLTREGIVETRRAIHALRGETMPLRELLQGVADSYRVPGGPAAVLEAADVPEGLSGDTTTTIYRAAQEALTNVRKHAPGASIRIRLRCDEEDVTLTVANKLPAVRKPDATGGFGLKGLRERAQALGGALHAGVDDGDWVLTMRVPR